MSDSEIKALLLKYKKFVVYGLSPDPSKPSHGVPLFMQSKGYEVVGIYPGSDSDSAQFQIYQFLKDVPGEFRKFVDVFRRAEHIPQIVDEIIALGGTEVLWLQLGITHPEAEKKAAAAGIQVVSDRCLKIEYKKIFG